MAVTRVDPYKHKERYERWKYERHAALPSVSDVNAELIRSFLFDMELGINTARASRRGPRSHIRLNTLKAHLTILARWFEKSHQLESLADCTQELAARVFGDIRSGVIRRKDGKPYASAGDLVKDFKTFWHWHIKRQRQAGAAVEDIAYHLDARVRKPKWVYLTAEQVYSLCDAATFKYRVLMMFLLDSSVRSPSELVNLRVGDFSEDFTRLHIRDDISKTFGRRINILLCSQLLRDYVRHESLQSEDRMFPISPAVTNRYLKRLATRVLGTGISPAGKPYSSFTLYDFRHAAACFWLPRYKSESGLKYRFGWKQSDRIHYYTEMLGMRDTIRPEDIKIED